MKGFFKKLGRILDSYVPVSPPKPLTEEESKKREREIINKINRRAAMRDNC